MGGVARQYRLTEITYVFPQGLMGLDRDFTVTFMNLIVSLISYSITVFLSLSQ